VPTDQLVFTGFATHGPSSDVDRALEGLALPSPEPTDR